MFGQNNDGQLGLGDYEDRDVPTLLPNVNNVKSVHAGYYFSMIILSKYFFIFFYFFLFMAPNKMITVYMCLEIMHLDNWA